MEILFKNVTAVTMQKERPVLYGADVGVKDGRITFGAAAADRVIDGTGKVLIPGMYNCHAHSPMSLLRGFANDLALEPWLTDHIWPTEAKIKEMPGAVRTGALLAIAEMISSGTVSFNDMYFYLPVIAQAVEESGMKANLSNGIFAFNPDGYDYRKTSEYAETSEIVSTFHKSAHGRIKAEASIHCAYTSHPAAWEQVRDFAKEHQLTIHVHLSETIAEHNNSVNQFGMTPAEAFAKHGVFDVPSLAAHACWATEDDIEILARHAVSVAHNPVSNLKLASGIAPIVAMQKAGINIALGTDGMASNNSHDLFEEIKIASILQKCAVEDPTAVPAFDVLEMATVNGAKAQGRQGGQITEGADADLVLLDFDNPRQVPCYDPLLSLAYNTTGRDVLMTLCQGKVLYENGEFKTVDVERVLHEARAIGEKV